MKIRLHDNPTLDPVQRKYEEEIVKNVNSMLMHSVNSAIGNYVIQVKTGLKYRYILIRFNDVTRTGLFKTMMLADGSIDIKPRCKPKTFYREYWKHRNDPSFDLSLSLISMIDIENPLLPSFNKKKYHGFINVRIDNIDADCYNENDIIYDLILEMRIAIESED